MNIITGLQANSDLHIGNYFGAVKPMVDSYNKMSENDKFFYFVPNLHSFTSPIDHTILYQNTLNNIKTLLASGVDSTDPKVYLFRQSRVSEHAELAWALQCFTYYGEASRMTQFKDKSLKNENFSVGLLTYPVLMAADILLYDCDYVPVGLDQQQHIELTRDIALRFNHKFGDIFLPPLEWSKQLEYLNRTKGLKILSLSDPTKKMSKSDYDSKGCVFMTDKPEDIIKKVMSASTDSLSSINFDPINQAGISNLLTILACVRSQTIEEVTQEFQGESRYGDFKKIVATELSEFVETFQSKFNKITNQELETMLEVSEKKVKSIATQKLNKVYKVLGL
jgi:tryptophanyl-tRNA synthetase